MYDIQNFINDVKTGRHPYDLIAQHYWEMERGDLGRICLEFIHELEDWRTDNVIEELEDFITE